MNDNKFNYLEKIKKQLEPEKRKSVFIFILKLIILFVIINLIPLLFSFDIGNISIYQSIVDSRERFPFGEAPREAYNFSLFNLEAMFRSHELQAMDDREEFSVVILGDSSVWGTLLHNDETLTGQLNLMNLKSSDNLPVHFYNAGYPTISVTKDLMILDEIQERYQPDAVLWMVTLEAFPWEKQFASPLVEDNVAIVIPLLEEYGVYYIPETGSPETFFNKTILGKRREIADVIRLQFYGLLWDATRIDQYIPDTYNPAQRDLESNDTYYNFSETEFSKKDLAFDVIAAGSDLLDEGIPLIIINEPIMVSEGENSDIRYNFYYPRWAYDLYRNYLEDYSSTTNLLLLDFWNLVPENEFTNSAIHLSPEGEKMLAEAVKGSLIVNEIIQE